MRGNILSKLENILHPCRKLSTYRTRNIRNLLVHIAGNLAPPDSTSYWENI
jgi:hypothetical protein